MNLIQALRPQAMRSNLAEVMMNNVQNRESGAPRPGALSAGNDQVSFSKTVKILFGNTTALTQLFPKAGDIPTNLQMPAFDGSKKLLINGELREWNGPFQDIASAVLERSTVGGQEKLTPKIIGQLPIIGEAQAMEALDAASKAYNKGLGEWPMMSTGKRIECLKNFIQDMKPQRETVAKLEMYEIGKSYEDCLKEFDRTIEYMDKSIDALQKMEAESTKVTELGGKLKKETRTPKGVALCLGPYNYPLNEEFAGMIPALLMVNTIICKLPRIGALCNTPLYEAFQKNFPKGVINFITGDGGNGGKLVKPIMESGKVDIFSFIGSEGVANLIEKMHPNPNRLTSVLGLGAKNPAIVLPDADIDKAVKECVTGGLSFNGQRCTALKIQFVHKDVAKAFSEKLAAAASALKVGMPHESGVKITPLPNEGNVSYMKELIQDAIAKGATVLNADQGGGSSVGTLFKPAVVVGVKPNMRLYSEEQFGPIIPVVTYDSLDEVVDYVSNSPVGQQASIFGKNPATIDGLVKNFKNQFCRVNINEQCARSPDEFAFDGRKNSAKGTLSITDALKIFSTMNMITMQASDENKELIKQLNF